MLTVEQIFDDPLFVQSVILLVIGVGVSSIPLAFLTHWLDGRRRQRDIQVENLRRDREIAVERNRKELEIKTDIASKIVQTVSYQLANLQSSVGNEKAIPTDVFDENIRKFYVDANIIRSMLQTYFSKTDLTQKMDLIQKWGDYTRALISFSVVSSKYLLKNPTIEERENLKYNLDEIRKYSKDNEKIDWTRLTADLTYEGALRADCRISCYPNYEELAK